MARFFRLPVVPVGTDVSDDWVVNTDSIANVRRFGKKVVLSRTDGFIDLSLYFETEDQAKDFITTNFLLFNR